MRADSGILRRPVGRGQQIAQNFPYPLWVPSEGELECVEHLGNAFDMVKEVDANNDLEAVEALLEGCGLRYASERTL